MLSPLSFFLYTFFFINFDTLDMVYIQLETTPRVYYQSYITSDPCYDLYPSLSRRLGNGYIQLQRPTHSSDDIDFTTIHIPYAKRLALTEDPFWQTQEEEGQWDLYPSILRSVSIT